MTTDILTPDLYARLACDQPNLRFIAGYDSQGVTLTDPQWTRWLCPTAGPSATILVVEVCRQLTTADTWDVSPKLLAGLLGIGRARLATAIARAIRFRVLYPYQNGALALDLRPIPPQNAILWPPA